MTEEQEIQNVFREAVEKIALLCIKHNITMNEPKFINFCPFCGSKDIIHVFNTMECQVCGATGPKCQDKSPEEFVLDRWNNRFKESDKND